MPSATLGFLSAFHLASSFSPCFAALYVASVQSQRALRRGEILVNSDLVPAFAPLTAPCWSHKLPDQAVRDKTESTIQFEVAAALEGAETTFPGAINADRTVDLTPHRIEFSSSLGPRQADNCSSI